MGCSVVIYIINNLGSTPKQPFFYSKSIGVQAKHVRGIMKRFKLIVIVCGLFLTCNVAGSVDTGFNVARPVVIRKGEES